MFIYLRILENNINTISTANKIEPKLTKNIGHFSWNLCT